MRLEVGDFFTVSFEGPEDAELAAQALESLNRAYWRICDVFGTFPPKSVPVVLYTREQFRDVTRSPQWAAAAYDGIIRVPMRGAGEKGEDLDRVLAHEFAHALIRSLATRNLPTWLNEGLASVLESDDLGWANRTVAKVGKMPSLRRLAGAVREVEWGRGAVCLCGKRGGGAPAPRRSRRRSGCEPVARPRRGHRFRDGVPASHPEVAGRLRGVARRRPVTSTTCCRRSPGSRWAA